VAESVPKNKGRMPEDELLALIRSYELASLGSQVAAGATISTTVFPSNQAMTTLEIDRYNALNAYFARPLGNEVENRSQVVLPELRDTLEWIMPQLMRMFVGTTSVFRFDAENPQDEEQAELETAVVNHVFMQQNNGFFVLHDFFKDALLMRNGYVEVYSKESEEVSEEKYSGLSEIELTSLLQPKDKEKIEVLEQDEDGQGFTEVKLRRTAKVNRICVVCIPPEEMRITPRAREGMENLAFAMHITTKARSDLITEGFDEEVVNSLASGRPNWLEIDALARNQTVDQLSIESPSDYAMQEIELRKVIMRVDYDGDGVAELRRVLIGGDKIIENEVIEETPFASCAPKRMPHRHTGLSLYDEIMDLQVIKTTLWRQGLDNLTIANNQRVAVDWRNCNFDDLLSSRPGGVVRGNGPPNTWIQPLEQPSNMIEQVLPTLQYIDELRANRTGIGRSQAGLNPDELQDVTKGAMLAQMVAAALKVELVARLLAEGVKDIARKIHGELIRHQDQPLYIEIAGKWQQVDPTSWRRRTKVSVNVGLGSGNREEMRANVQILAAAQAQLVQMGMVGPQQAWETFRVMCESMGFANPERFAMDPASDEYKQHMQQMANMPIPPAPQVQAAQIKAQAEAASQQSEDQRAIMKLQGEILKEREGRLSDRLQMMQQLTHEGSEGRRQREVELDAAHKDIVLHLIQAFSSVLSTQAKSDPGMDAGAEMGKDVNEADSMIENPHEKLIGALTQLGDHFAQSNKPKVATLSDGRQIRIAPEETK